MTICKKIFNFCLVTAVFVFAPCVADGQINYKRFFSALRQANPAQPAENALRRAVTHALQKRPLPAQPPLASSVFRLQEKNPLLRYFGLEGTGFVLEETYQGKKYLWGVSVSHYLFQHPRIKYARTFPPSQAAVSVQGSAGMNDVTLFALPPEIAARVKPLTLAEGSPAVGETLHSIVFLNKHVQYDARRIVQEIYPHRFITSLEMDPDQLPREGTCGSPVLNEAEQVVGIHIGNSPKRQIGFVLPAEHIRRALAAAHQVPSRQPLIFNTVTIGDLSINEFVKQVQVFSGNKFLRSRSIHRLEKALDYTHLENLIDTRGATHVVFVIEQNPLSPSEKDQKYHTYLLSYDLVSGQVTRRQDDRYAFFLP